MYEWSIPDVGRKLAEALKIRDAAYLRYIHNDSCDFSYPFDPQDNRWALDRANREVAELRREVTHGHQVV